MITSQSANKHEIGNNHLHCHVLKQAELLNRRALFRD